MTTKQVLLALILIPVYPLLIIITTILVMTLKTNQPTLTVSKESVTRTNLTEADHKQEVLVLIKKYVQDPAGLEIVDWGPPVPYGLPPYIDSPAAKAEVAKGNYHRMIKIRCALIGYDTSTRTRVMLDTIEVSYSNNLIYQISFYESGIRAVFDVKE